MVVLRNPEACSLKIAAVVTTEFRDARVSPDSRTSNLNGYYNSGDNLGSDYVVAVHGDLMIWEYYSRFPETRYLRAKRNLSKRHSSQTSSPRHYSLYSNDVTFSNFSTNASRDLLDPGFLSLYTRFRQHLRTGYKPLNSPLPRLLEC